MASFDYSSNAHYKRTSSQPPKDQAVFSDFWKDYNIASNSFELPGLGKEGSFCNSERVKEVREDGKKIKVGRYRCKNVKCPNCWEDWARKRVFEIALRLVGYCKKNDENIYFSVASVPPDDVYNWDWDKVNTSLFRRFRRRAEGIKGGYQLFHPFRIKREKNYNFCKKNDCDSCRFIDKCVKGRLVRDGWGSGYRDAGYWKGIRKDALELGSWKKYINLSPHLHNLVIGEPKSHSGEDFFISYQGSGGSPNEKSLDEVIGYLYYIITHIGVASDEFSKNYLKATRSFGEIYNFNPKNVLSEDVFNSLATKIAKKVGMVWDSSNNSLDYPIDDNLDSNYSWFSIWEFTNDKFYKEFIEDLDEDLRDFYGYLREYIIHLYEPPPFDWVLDFGIPEDLEVVFEGESNLSMSPGTTQNELVKEILNLISTSSVTRTEVVSLLDLDSSRVSRALDKLIDNGKVIDSGIGLKVSD